MHFQDESGQVLEYALLDGYLVAERLLEGVMFEVRIINDELQVKIRDEDVDYFSTINDTAWLNEAKIFAEDVAREGEYFMHPETNEETVRVVDG